MRITFLLFLILGFTKLQAQDSCKITYISNKGLLIETHGNLEACSSHFKEMENITIFEQKMNFIYYETSK